MINGNVFHLSQLHKTLFYRAHSWPIDTTVFWVFSFPDWEKTYISWYLVEICSLSKYGDNRNSRLMGISVGLMETSHESKNMH